MCFNEKIEEAKIKEELWDLKVEVILYNFLKDIKVGSEILMLNTYNILKYNVSQRDIDDFKSFCRYNSKGSPDVLSVEIYQRLIKDCKNFTENQKQMYAIGLQMLGNVDIKLELKFKIAYLGMNENDLNLVETVVKYAKGCRHIF
uniref:Uncharacterized protein n=1 Tax=Panagrolaimus superbus TaxID=310955 RepID=A0A914YHM7_9BILA